MLSFAGSRSVKIHDPRRQQRLERRAQQRQRVIPGPGRDAALRLGGHEGLRQRAGHMGHRGVVVATVEGELIERKGDSEEGMVMDFKFLKEIMVAEIHDKLDHGFAVWKEDLEDLDFIMKRNSRVLVTDEPPTAECLAKWAFNQLQRHLPEGVRLQQLRWYETPNNWADYEGL